MNLMKCSQCDFLYINGIGCHETGCPTARQERLAEQIEESFWEESI